MGSPVTGYGLAKARSKEEHWLTSSARVSPLGSSYGYSAGLQKLTCAGIQKTSGWARARSLPQPEHRQAREQKQPKMASPNHTECSSGLVCIELCKTYDDDQRLSPHSLPKRTSCSQPSHSLPYPWTCFRCEELFQGPLWEPSLTPT